MGIWRHGLRTMLRIERAQLQPLRGFRLALGAAIPLIGGAAIGHADIGAFASAGALGVGFGGFLGGYRTQAATMIAAATAIAVSMFVGSVAGHSTPITTALVLAWGFGAGLLGVFGAAAYFVGLQSVLHLLIGSGFPGDVGEAALRAIAAFAGGALQTLLIIGVWPLRRFARENSALADAYRSLARWLSGAPAAGTLPPSLAASGIYAALDDPYPFADHRDMSTLQRLLDEAEQIRVSLAALAVPQAPEDSTMQPAANLREAAAGVLNEIAQALQAGRAPAGQGPAWSVLESAATPPAARSGEAHAPQGQTLRDVHLRRLLGQLRSAWRIATDGADQGLRGVRDATRKARLLDAREAMRTLRAALTVRSSAFRHALRVAIAVAVATALARATALPNGYWLPIAVLFVLQPGLGDTISRGFGMMSGTVAGALLATMIAALTRPSPSMLTLLMAFVVWLCFTTFRANYAMFAACMTTYVVFLVSFYGLPEPVAALYRVFATLAGGAVALGAYALWPTFEARQVPARLAAALDAQARYAAALLAEIGSAAARNDAGIAKARLVAQRERITAEESVERMLCEPRPRRALASSKALGSLAATRTFALAGLVLDGARPDARCPSWPALDALSRGIEQNMTRIAAALRSDSAAAPLSPLRALHAGLAGELAPDESAVAAQAGECRTLRRLTVSETDLMVDSVETIASLARRAGPRHARGARRPVLRRPSRARLS